MAWTVDSSGTQTATIGTEHTLATPTTNATYYAEIDTNNLALGDTVELRAYDMVDGTNLRQLWVLTFQNAQAAPAKAFPFIGVTTSCRFTLKQTAGTGRAFPWSVRRI